MGLNRQNIRRLEHLLYKQFEIRDSKKQTVVEYLQGYEVSVRLAFENQKNSKIPKQYIEKTKERVEIFDLRIKLGISWEDFAIMWNEKVFEYKTNRAAYNKKPKLIKQDNKGYINGSGGGYTRDIRYPSKKRKTTWKRFYKLFPKLDPNNKDENK